MATLTRTMQLELGTRKAGARTYSAVLSTEAPVRRRGFDGDFLEILSHAKDAIDLSRAPLPLIESHDARALPIGIVDNVRITDGKLRGEVTFGTSQRAQEIAADVEAGIIRNLSVGYSIDKVVEGASGNQKTLTATRWTPHEVSAVAIGADANAGFGRSYTMPDETDTTNTTATTYAISGTVKATPATEGEGDQRSLERARCAEIYRLTRVLGDEPAFAERMIESGASLDGVRAQLIERRASRETLAISSHHPSIGAGGYTATRGHNEPSSAWMARHAHVSSGTDAGPDFRAAAADAILLRAGVPLSKPHAAARDVSGSVLDLARVCVSRNGQTVNGGNEALLKRAMSTSDFPLILADAMHKATMRGYETEPSSHRAWVRPQAVPDFRDQHRVILGSAPGLEQVLEGGEYKNGALEEGGTSYRISKFGRIVTLTWETLLHDNLGAFVRIQPAMGQAARRLEADTVYDLFALNAGAGPTMQDSVALFHLSHANLGTAAAFDADALGAARTMLRKQTAVGGGYLSLVPRYFIIAPELEQEAEVIVAQATRSVTTVDSATPQWIAGLEIVVEPRLDDGAFYLAADSAQIDHCELGLLEENFNGPIITEDRSEEFRRDVYSWKVKHSVGAKFLDWRGIVKQPIS